MRTITLITIIITTLNIAKSQEPILDSTDRKVFTIAGVSSVIGLTGAFLTDPSVKDYLQQNQNRTLDRFTDYTNPMGDKFILFPANALVYGSGLLFKDQRLQKTSLNAFKSMIATGILTEGAKQVFGRARPLVDKGPHYFDPFPIFRDNDSKYKSLPSGHVSLAFAFFTPFAEEYTEWLYLIPVSVVFSRVYKNKHWTSDAVLGATIGFFTGYFFQEKNRNIEVSFNKIVIKF